MPTDETSHREFKQKAHHRQTAIDFRRWIVKNPDVSQERKAEAFNAIADSNFYKFARLDRKQKKTSVN